MKKSFTRLRRKPRLPVLRSSLLRRMDKAAGLHRAHHDVDGYVPSPEEECENLSSHRPDDALESCDCTGGDRNVRRGKPFPRLVYGGFKILLEA